MLSGHTYATRFHVVKIPAMLFDSDCNSNQEIATAPSWNSNERTIEGNYWFTTLFAILITLLLGDSRITLFVGYREMKRSQERSEKREHGGSLLLQVQFFRSR